MTNLRFVPLNYTNKIEDLEKKYNHDDLLIFGLFDYFPGVDYISIMQHMIGAGYKTAWVFSDHYEHNHDKMPTGAPILFIPNMLLMVYFQVHKQKLCEVSTKWNHSTGKFLFLTGKPFPRNRSGLLYDFYQSGLLDKAKYSFFLPDASKTECRNLFSWLSDHEYDKFVETVLGSPDQVNPIESGNSLHYSGIPFDVRLFSDTSFRVISETWYEVPSVTEKTYITMMNRHPFIMAGRPGTLKKLRQFGFSTYEKYLPITDYDEIQDHDLRMSAVVENTRFWLENISGQEKEIQKDIEHNCNLFYKYADEITKSLVDLTKSYGVECDPYYIIPLYDVTDDWMRFYYRIKDPSWPSCYHHNQFHLLPEHIRKECVEVFNYQPKES